MRTRLRTRAADVNAILKVLKVLKVLEVLEVLEVLASLLLPTQSTTAAATAPSARAGLAAYAERRSIVMIALGFSSGLPFLLIFDTLSAWLREVGLTLEVIGSFSLATLVFSLKFLWAPLIDRTRIPILTAWLGHRRSWMLVCQAFLILGLALVAGQDPASRLGLMAALAVFVGFSAASQDIAIDAWRIEVSDDARQGTMAAAYQWGYRAATLTAGAVPLVIADAFGWNLSYAVMAALMGIGVLATLAAPREPQHMIRGASLEDVPRVPLRDGIEWAARLVVLAIGALLLGSGLAANATLLRTLLTAFGFAETGASVASAWQSTSGIWFQMLAVLAGFAVIIAAVSPIPGTRTLPGAYLSTALSEPLKVFIAKYGRAAGPILALICLYRLPDFVINIMNPFYLDLGFTLTEVAEVRKVFGVFALMGGVLAGGWAIARFGMMPSLLAGAFAGAIGNLVFIWLATQGHDLPSLFVAIGFDNVLSGFSGTCLIAYMSSLTTAGFTATQYALFSSLYALPGKILASQSGRLVEAAAHNAEAGGVASVLLGLFASLPSESFADALEKSGVGPAALASGYVAFFIYSAAIGLVAIALTFIVRNQTKS